MAPGGKKSCAKSPEVPPPGKIITQIFDDILIQKDISNIFFKNDVITFYLILIFLETDAIIVNKTSVKSLSKASTENKNTLAPIT